GRTEQLALTNSVCANSLQPNPSQNPRDKVAAGIRKWPRLAILTIISILSVALLGEYGMGSRRRGSGRRKVGRKKRRMRAKIRHRKQPRGAGFQPALSPGRLEACPTVHM